MTCASQRVVPRGRMQQCIEAIVDDTQNCPGSRAFGYVVNQDAPEGPLVVVPPCQSEIKRTLKARQLRP